MLTGELAGVLYHIADLGQHQSRLAHEAFESTLAKIRGQCLTDLLFVLLNRVTQFLEHLNAEPHGKRRPASKIASLFFKNGINHLCFHVNSNLPLDNRTPPVAVRP